MTTSKPRDQATLAFERLKPFYEDAARTHFGGAAWKGFKFWALSELLIDTELSDDDIKSAVEIDGRSDLGLDGYVEDAEASGPSLTLVQSKYHDPPTGVGNSVLAEFFDAMPQKLLNPEVVVASANPLVQDAHRALKEAIASGARLRFIFLTSGWLTQEGRTYADSNRLIERVYDSVTLVAELEVFDGPALQNLYDSHLTSAQTNTDVTMSLQSAPHHEATVGGFRVFVGSLPARELVRAFELHKFALFRLNPRGPLKNTVNAGIKRTLTDPNKRKLFYLFNNGVTATCESWRVANDTLEVRGLQIVNGCQTTVTLASAKAIVDSDPEIKVAIRVIEGSSSGLKEDIASATNTQSRLTAQDFKSNDDLQRDLKKQFDSLPEPIFYEIKRGDWDVLVANKGAQTRYEMPGTKGSYRRMKMKDVAQATLAFLGEPGKAKDQSRTIFESGETYAKVFPPTVRAEQLLLPVELYRRADALCAEWSANFAGAPYARYALIALVGTRLRKSTGLLSARDSSLARADSQRLDALLLKARNTVAMLHATMEAKYPGHREFFRSSEYFDQMRTAFQSIPD